MSIEFSEWLTEELKKRDWSQADLSRHAKISRASISNVLSGMRQAGPDLCESIARAFKVPPETVFRAAGILPNSAPQNEEKDRLLHRINQLTPEEQSLVDDLIETLLTRREFRARKAQQQTPEPDTP